VEPCRIHIRHRFALEQSHGRSLLKSRAGLAEEM
jgi:hypothetical protein